MFDIRIDGSASIYEQIYNEVVRLITLGVLAPDEKLPAVRETAKSLGVNPNTVQKAYAMLEKNGLVYSVPAKGSYVSPDGEVANAVRREAENALKEAAEKAFAAGVTLEAAETIIKKVWEGGEDPVGKGKG